MTPKLKRTSSLPAVLRWIAVTLLAGCAAPAVLAEGVVVKSSAAEHPIGSVVADGEQLRLSQGQSITVLDKSGVVVVRTEGRYAGPTSRETSGFLETAKAMAEGPRAKSAIGGTRSECTVAGAKGGEACVSRDAAARRLRVTAYTPATSKKAAVLTLASSFEGVAVCTAWNGNEDAVFLPGADPEHPLKLNAPQPVHLVAPKGVSAKAVIGLRSVDCAGVSIKTWQTFQVSASSELTPNAAAVIMSAFARMQGDASAEARFTAKARKPSGKKAHTRPR